MPDRALYYPNWGISNPQFLAECLLYWNRMSCIVPFAEFGPSAWHQDPEMQRVLEEAHAAFVTGVAPTPEQKRRAHERISQFAEHEPPDWCRPENLQPHQKSTFSASKIAPETVELLRAKGWVSDHPSREDFQVAYDAAANLVMEALARECSSKTMPPVTDDVGTFTSSCNLLLKELGSATGVTTTAKPNHQEHYRGHTQSDDAEAELGFLLAKIPYLRPRQKDFDPATLRRILRARNEPDIQGYRAAFRKIVDQYLDQMRTVEAGEKTVIADEFGHEVNSNLKRLRKELRRAGIHTFIARSGVVAVLIGALSAVGVEPRAGMALNLAHSLVEYQDKRRRILDDNWSSWIISVQTKRFSFW